MSVTFYLTSLSRLNYFRESVFFVKKKDDEISPSGSLRFSIAIVALGESKQREIIRRRGRQSGAKRDRGNRLRSSRVSGVQFVGGFFGENQERGRVLSKPTDTRET